MYWTDPGSASVGRKERSLASKKMTPSAQGRHDGKEADATDRSMTGRDEVLSQTGGGHSSSGVLYLGYFRCILPKGCWSDMGKSSNCR